MTIAKILEVNPEYTATKREGGTYQAFHIKYQSEEGVRDDYRALSFVKNDEKLYSQLSSLSVGDIVELNFVQNGKYKNLVSITPAPEGTAAPVSKYSSTAYTSKKGSTSYVDNSIGLQVGNALNNAALLLAHKAASGTLEKVAEEILTLGETLKQRLKDGKYVAAVAKTTPVKAAPIKTTKVVDDFDIDPIPFD